MRIPLRIGDREPGIGNRERAQILVACCALMLAACAGEDTTAPIVIELAGAAQDAPIVETFAVDGAREVELVAGDTAIVVEAWVDGGTLDAGAAWMAPRPMSATETLVVTADGEVTLTVWPRGAPPPF